MNDFFEFLEENDGSLCDCCGVSIDDHVLHTLEMACPVTLCRSCILRFYALLDQHNGCSLRVIRSDGSDDQTPDEKT